MTKRICSVDCCDRPVKARGLCNGHYRRLRNGVPVSGPLQVYRKKDRRCSIEGCNRPHEAKGLCRLHFQRAATGTPLGQPLRIVKWEGPCSVEDCDRAARKLGFCEAHYQRAKKNVDLSAPILVKGGDTIKYSAAHHRVWDSRGRATDHPCIDCGKPAEDWSYNNSGVKERTEQRPGCVNPIRYSTDPLQYDPRCKSCHRRFDLAV